MGDLVAAGLLVLAVVVIPLMLVVGLLAGVVAWAVLRPAEGEPAGRAGLRRASGTTAAAATASAVVVLAPWVVLGVRAAELAALGVALAALLHVVVLWCGEALAARPHAARRTALLTTEPPSRWRTALQALMAASSVGLLAVLLVAGLDGRAGDLLPVEPVATLLVVAPALVLVVVVATAVRQVRRQASDARLHPEVDAAGRARAEHRLLRAGAAAPSAVLGLLLLGTELQSRASAGDDPVLAVVLLGGGLVVVAAVASLLPVPPLPLLPDREPAAEVAAGAGNGVG